MDFEKELKEKLMNNAYTFEGLCKRFPNIKTNVLAQEMILLAHRGKLEIRFHRKDVFMMMRR